MGFFKPREYLKAYAALFAAGTVFIVGFATSGGAAGTVNCVEHPERCVTSTTTQATTTQATTTQSTTARTTTTTATTTARTTTEQTTTARTTTTASTTTTAPPTTTAPTVTSATALPLLFNGGFTATSYLPWNRPQCANYGQPNATYIFGNFSVVSDIVGSGSYASRYDLPADGTHLTRCQLITPRPVNTGKDDFYSLMFYVPNGWTPGTGAFWGLEIAQFNLQNLGPGGPTIALQAHADHVTLAMQTGITTVAKIPYQYDSNADSPGFTNLPPLYAIPPGMQLGVWHELIVHAHWATDATGQIEVWHRLKGQTAWTKTVSLSGYPTLQTRADGSYPPTTIDMIGAYRGRSTTPTSVWLDGFSRSQSFASAATNLP